MLVLNGPSQGMQAALNVWWIGQLQVDGRVGELNECRLQNYSLLTTLVVGHCRTVKGKGSPYSITERPELIPALGSQPAGDVSHKPGGRLPLLSARPAVTPAILKRAATNFAAW